MMVNVSLLDDWTVQGPDSQLAKVMTQLRPKVAKLVRRLLRTDNPVLHSPAILPSSWPKRLNASDADVLHLHWITHEMLSIVDVGQLNKPIVWTLHDMWPFCGAEHYTNDIRWREGYLKNNRPRNESGFDLNRWTWVRKKKHWLYPMQIITPSNWLADCVRDSILMANWQVNVIENPIDTDRWKPIDKALARNLLGLPQDKTLVMFGAMGGGSDLRKGFDLLINALAQLREDEVKFQLVIFGQSPPEKFPDLGFSIHYISHLHDDLSLQVLYCASDLLVIPSRQDNLPNTGVEAHACGTPVVAFNIGGLSDIVDHKRTGYLAEAFEVDDLARGIKWVLDNAKTIGFSENARDKAIAKFSYPVVAQKYKEIYKIVKKQFSSRSKLSYSQKRAWNG
ncbi:glycosyl transferase [Desulfofustis limnaeus]|uniref:Glycosyl transferase n=2 Tax=Desulfofustis limnaeus TaxID=2740163 RepID=A0ABN6M1Z3_9BACT|nr:glycosyl transferase [Desulfofustis limnaeus]